MNKKELQNQYDEVARDERKDAVNCRLEDIGEMKWQKV